MANSQSPLVGGGQTVSHQYFGTAATNTVSSAIHVLANEKKKDCYVKYAVHVVLVLDNCLGPSMPIATPRTKKPTQKKKKKKLAKASLSMILSATWAKEYAYSVRSNRLSQAVFS